LVLLLHGIAKGEPTARLARELGRFRKQFHTRRRRLEANLHETTPTDVMTGTAVEAGELYPKAGKNSTPHPDPSDPPRRRATKQQGHGISTNDRPSLISVVSRDTSEHLFWVCDHVDTRTCAALIAEQVPTASTWLCTDEWAREDDGEGRREVHGHTCEGAGAALRTYRRAFRGVHKRDLHLYVATHETIVNTTRVTPTLIRRMCACNLFTYTGYT
jgi:transposase